MFLSLSGAPLSFLSTLSARIKKDHERLRHLQPATAINVEKSEMARQQSSDGM